MFLIFKNTLKILLVHETFRLAFTSGGVPEILRLRHLCKFPSTREPFARYLLWKRFYQVNDGLEYLVHYPLQCVPGTHIILLLWKSPLVNFPSTGATTAVWEDMDSSAEDKYFEGVICRAINILNCRISWRDPYCSATNRKRSSTLILLRVEPQKSHCEMEQVLTPHQHVSNYDIKFLQC